MGVFSIAENLESEAIRPHSVAVSQADLPLELWEPGDALALIIGTDGPAYRPVGAGMIVRRDGSRIGNLSAGCIDADIALQAQAARAEGQPRRLRYGRGSPFRDLELPCGGGLDIAVLPEPDAAELRQACLTLSQRCATPVHFRLDAGGGIRLIVQPKLRFVVFGKGPEARSFARIAQAADYLVELFTPDAATLHDLPGVTATLQGSAQWPTDLQLDRFSAITIFFHDHDQEPPLLAAALRSEAGYIGAMGSRRAHHHRLAVLTESGMPPAQLARLSSPFGLIPSVRNPQALAISVLAEVLDRMHR
jgi:xanthine dehydrogenase accessory factor